MAGSKDYSSEGPWKAGKVERASGRNLIETRLMRTRAQRHAGTPTRRPQRHFLCADWSRGPLRRRMTRSPRQTMALEVGSRLGHYDVTALIGASGAGEVYQAPVGVANPRAANRVDDPIREIPNSASSAGARMWVSGL